MAEQDQVIPYVPFPELTSIAEKAKEYLPKFERGSALAVEAMTDWLNGGELQDDEEKQSLNDFLANVRESGTKMQTMRMELTRPIDELKARISTYEKPLLDDKDSMYTKCRAMITRYDQAKINEKNRIEREAAARKARDNKLVELRTQILLKLNDKVLELTKTTEEFSVQFFKDITLEQFEKNAASYRGWNPKMKEADWVASFAVDKRWLEETPENIKWLDELKVAESYAKWNAAVVAACLPIINEWRAKLPQIKEDIIKLNNAKSESERQRLAAEQKAKEDADAERRNQEIQRQHLDQSNAISEQAQLDKLENEFVEQATTQQVGDTGPKKLVLKFKDPKVAMKALTNIIYQSMASKEFPGIEKKVKGKPVLDQEGRPEYIEAIQWWIDFFMKNCDAEIEGTQVFEYSKTIVRK